MSKDHKDAPDSDDEANLDLEAVFLVSRIDPLPVISLIPAFGMNCSGTSTTSLSGSYS